MRADRTTLSVVMPSYNYGHYLAGALEAILTQSRPADEVIVVDDCSTDDSYAIAESFAGRYRNMRLLRNERNLGVAENARRCLREAHGEYLFSTSADDRVLPGCFERMMAVAQRWPQAGMICCDVVNQGPEGSLVGEYRMALADQTRYFSPPDIRHRLAAGSACLSGSNAFFRRDAFDAVGLHPELRWHHDWFYSSAVALRHGLCYVPETLVMFRIHGGSYSSTGWQQSKAQREVVEIILNLLKTDPFRDVLRGFQSTGALGCLPAEVLPAILSRPRHWGFLSWPLLRRLGQRAVLRFLARMTPRWMKERYRAARLHRIQARLRQSATPGEETPARPS